MQSPHSIGPYEVVRQIATGGMAEIFLCRQTGPSGFQRPVVVKRIHSHLAGDKEFVSMFISEAKVVAGLSHANLVDVMDFGIADGSYFIAMEYVDGPNLKAITRRAQARGRLLPIPLCVHILEQTSAGLVCAHRAADQDGQPLRLVHRDVSPQNILLSFAGEVKLTDFGIAKVSTQAHDSKAGTLKGKIAYMSPEQARGRSLDARSDIFSLGVVGYEILTGERLFQGRSDVETLEKVRAARVPRPRSADPSIPPELERTILRMLAADAEARYPSTELLQKQLAQMASSLGARDPATELGELVTAIMEDEQDDTAPPPRWGRPLGGGTDEPGTRGGSTSPEREETTGARLRAAIRKLFRYITP